MFKVLNPVDEVQSDSHASWGCLLQGAPSTPPLKGVLLWRKTILQNSGFIMLSHRTLHIFNLFYPVEWNHFHTSPCTATSSDLVRVLVPNGPLVDGSAAVHILWQQIDPLQSSVVAKLWLLTFCTFWQLFQKPTSNKFAAFQIWSPPLQSVELKIESNNISTLNVNHTLAFVRHQIFPIFSEEFLPKLNVVWTAKAFFLTTVKMPGLWFFYFYFLNGFSLKPCLPRQ